MAEIEGSKITDITGGSELDKMDARAKAAVVVVSLGADRASQIYKYLSEQEIEDLTYEVAKLGKTNNAQVENALDEFYKMCLTHKMMTDGGLDYARSVLEKAFGETTARNLLEKVSKTLQSKCQLMPHFVCHNLIVRVLQNVTDSLTLFPACHLIQIFSVKKNFSFSFSVRCQRCLHMF